MIYDSGSNFFEAVPTRSDNGARASEYSFLRNDVAGTDDEFSCVVHCTLKGQLSALGALQGPLQG